MKTIKTNVYYFVDDTGKKVYDTEEMRREFEQSLSELDTANYPFNEGDRYFTIEGDTIVESVWDEQSEELYSSDWFKMYFTSLREAVFYYQQHYIVEPKINLL